MIFRTGIIFFTAVMLTGCETSSWREAKNDTNKPKVVSRPSSEDEAAPEPVRSTPDSPGPRKPLKPINPDELVGLNEEEALGRLGPPLDVRKEAPATVWRYQREDCHLRLFFYPSLRDRRLQALTYEITPSGEGTEEGCLQEFGSYQNG